MNKPLYGWALLIACCISLQGCLVINKNFRQKMPYEGKDYGSVWNWESPSRLRLLSESGITLSEYKHQRVIAENTCKVQSLQVPIPSPSCVQPPKMDCSDATGFAAGFCKGYTPSMRCDYSAVDQARHAQAQIMESCMTLEGWERVWYRNIDLTFLGDTSGPVSEKEINRIANSIPLLVHWKREKPYLWELAIQRDYEMAYTDKVKFTNLYDRFRYVAEEILSSTCTVELAAQVFEDPFSECADSFPQLFKWKREDKDKWQAVLRKEKELRGSLIVSQKARFEESISWVLSAN